MIINCCFLVYYYSKLNKFAAVKRKNDAKNAYGFPGGKQEIGESLLDCINRECLEEGFIVKGQLFHFYNENLKNETRYYFTCSNSDAVNISQQNLQDSAEPCYIDQESLSVYFDNANVIKEYFSTIYKNLKN